MSDLTEVARLQAGDMTAHGRTGWARTMDRLTAELERLEAMEERAREELAMQENTEAWHLERGETYPSVKQYHERAAMKAGWTAHSLKRVLGETA